MAKIKHNNFIDTVDEVISGAKKEGVLHLYAEDQILNGRTLQIKGKKMFHFGTTGYLGLEQDIRLKEAAIEAIQHYGTQFPLSKTYISNPLYNELESKIEKMYGIPPIITKNSTLGHLAVIPTVVRDEDGVILDHQVHWSVQNACQLLKIRGIPVEMIRHNNLNMLEDKIKYLATRCNKIWYMADGVYSMLGDFAPIPELMELCKKYPQLQLYFDDVHGMSWRGKNGTGYVLDILKSLPDNVLLFGTLSKTFGASGATLLCTDNRLREKIKNFGGPLTFSAQLEPASVAAAIASADIHLSPEITSLQCDLSEKIEYFKSLLEKTALPMIALNNSPVFFLGTAMPLTAYKMVQRLFKDGFYVNPAIYPAVPIKNTGIRITLSRHNQKEEIKELVEAMEYHFPKALEESGNSQHKVNKAFGIVETVSTVGNLEPKTNLKLQYETSIEKINKQNWNELLGKQSIFDWEGLSFLENAFTNMNCPESNWDFHYYLITDKKGTPLVATFFTYGLWKDDMLAAESISLQLEEKRKQNPLYLTSKVLGMGSLFTEGDHCYINKTHPLAEEAIILLLEQVETLYHQLNADMLVLRDFEEDEQWNRIFHNQGFLKINMPETCIIQNNKWESVEEFSAALSSRSRKHFMKEILPFEQAFDIVIKDQLTNEESEQAYKLYQNVKNNNHAINTFTYPIEVFQKMESNPQWEFILLYLKNKEKEEITKPLVGILFCYKNTEHTYVPALIGMDYSYAKEFQLYRQLLFQGIKRARELNLNKIDFGVSATFEKRKLGASIIPKVAYIQARDNFSMELMGTLQNEDKTRSGN
ncbi:aminotransferase class I/II-fold pyridoxal phosphate-dependent enzyme [Flavobacterium gawalongense]|uniref:Aminotransferase class I/II-fold pyridoxal phosphate-dependent enzyme n=1 Tax=Flavobacterium gawalongense TaxID=2594432 RepID=A0ABY3CPZ6_9FLAO|nr:aminotransferase class I/II-fold pyridoxal phosphate-dependent enzyme [Flavobacterium gawalongense]TRW99018.1 aminotransferase class I/II-fold pyridoxal phosphate-dependent enzyme [Flavobacterium gawalongense]TRX09917.1 aminotransferase class I/II-fold pyridoxal phosphate-dependent enzyme [Flavobacterium gawalongense]